MPTKIHWTFPIDYRFIYVWEGGWATPMAVWSKALPLTASCLSPLSGFKSQGLWKGCQWLGVRWWVNLPYWFYVNQKNNTIFCKKICNQNFKGSYIEHLKNPVVSATKVRVRNSQGPRRICPRFCGGPLDSLDQGPKIVCIIMRNPVFGHSFLSKDLFGPLAWNLSVTPWR